MKFYNIFFSPTGGTKKVADIVAKGTKLDAEEIDLIKEPDKLMKVNFEKEDLCLVAVPSYGGIGGRQGRGAAFQYRKGTQGLSNPRHDGHPAAGTTSVFHTFPQG
jgi:hypothetical protein